MQFCGFPTKESKDPVQQMRVRRLKDSIKKASTSVATDKASVQVIELAHCLPIISPFSTSSDTSSKSST